MTNESLRIVTRGSLLALTQTRGVAAALEQANPGLRFEVTTLKTTGDRVTDRPLAQFGGVGVFVKELEQALLDRGADLAVHSLKDVPSQQPAGLTLASFPQREDPSDVLLTADGRTIDELPAGALVGTGSPRRIVQLKARRPDLRFSDLRGNLDTRIGKLRRGEYEAIVVAAAGMNRLGITFDPLCRLPFSVCLPAPGQGALAIECRQDDAPTLNACRRLNDTGVERQVLAERVFLRIVDAGCAAPVAALARLSGGGMVMETMVGDPASGRIARHRLEFSVDKAEEAAARLGALTLQSGAELGVLRTNG